MTVDTLPTRSVPTVFDAGLPSVAYVHLHVVEMSPRQNAAPSPQLAPRWVNTRRRLQ
jgi:hypothetical protein